MDVDGFGYVDGTSIFSFKDGLELAIAFVMSFLYLGFLNIVRSEYADVDGRSGGDSKTGPCPVGCQMSSYPAAKDHAIAYH